jgi:hypothetical protein
MKIEGLLLGGSVPAYIQCHALERVRLIPDMPVREKMGGVPITGFEVDTRDNEYWQHDRPTSSDALAGAVRTELRTEDEIPNGTRVTRAYIRDLRPETYPLYGHGRDDLKQTLGQGFSLGLNAPTWFDRLEGDRESLLINSYAGDEHAFEVIFPFRYGPRQVVVSECYYEDGTGDLFYAMDGVTIVDLKRHPFAPKGKLGRAIWKGGIYLRKGAEDLANGQPTQRARYDGYRQYEGAPRAEDIGPVVAPFTPVRVKVGQGDAMPMLPQVTTSEPNPDGAPASTTGGESTTPPAPAEPAPVSLPPSGPVSPAPVKDPAPAPAPKPLEPGTPEFFICAGLDLMIAFADSLVPLTAKAFPKEDDDVARVAKYARQAAERIRKSALKS